MKFLRWFVLTSIASVLSFSSQVKADIRMTAKSLKATADSIALSFASDAKLALVTSSEVDTAGKSSIWRYVYFSFDSVKEYHFLIQNDQVTFDTSLEMRIGIGIIDVLWIDSDSALSVAERERGSDIRQRFPGCTIMASLIRYVAPPFLCYWRIDYVCSDSTRTIHINAANGEVVTSTDQTDNRTLPIQPWLHQNYPNPFNPSTTIEFALPLASAVSLKVFNVLGQEIATIVDDHLAAGTHKVQWNAHASASGTYFYRLVACAHIEIKKLVLLK
jgi:hypothetical protein